jgi:hypothetical protein
MATSQVDIVKESIEPVSDAAAIVDMFFREPRHRLEFEVTFGEPVLRHLERHRVACVSMYRVRVPGAARTAPTHAMRVKM